MEMDDIEGLIGKANSFHEEGRYAEALDILRPVIGLNPPHWYPWFLAGICYRSVNDYDGAILHYSRAAEINPHVAQTFSALGIAYQQKEQWGEAVAALMKAIKIDPDGALSYNSLALTLKKCGEIEEAARIYDEGLKALVRHISKRMQSKRSNPVFKWQGSLSDLWMIYAKYGCGYLAERDKKDEYLFFTDYLGYTTEEEWEEKFGGEYWRDWTEEDGTTKRLYYPNILFTFLSVFLASKEYAIILGNIGVVLELLGKKNESERYFKEADSFAACSNRTNK